MKLARIFNVKNAQQIIEQVRNATTNWKQYAKESGVGRSSLELIDRMINA